MTPTEYRKLKEIKAIVKDGRHDQVTPDDKQWVLDLMKREGTPTPAEVIKAAKDSGFDVDGITSHESKVP